MTLTRRLNSALEAQGAEFLVLGHMLIQGIVCHKNYINMPDYDLIASSPELNTSARIQVKSRWATDYDGGFLIRNYNCDFVVHVALNRGRRYSKTGSNVTRDVGESDKEPPLFYVFPVDVVRTAAYKKSKWGKAFLRHIADAESYHSRWDLIAAFLRVQHGAAQSQSAMPA